MPHLSTPIRIAALTVTAALLTSCSSGSGGGDSGGGDPTSEPSRDFVSATRLTDAAGDSTLAPGCYAMGFVSPEADPPMVLIEVPAGYHGRGDGYEIAGADESSGFRHLDTWTVDEVATRACGDTEWVDPGPSVADLADALRSLSVWETTRPVPVTIGGHEGVFMELNVPARLRGACRTELSSWRAHLGGFQGIGAGKAQLLWIVEVDGQRLMLVVGYFPRADGPSPRLVEEMVAMAETAEFADADQVAP